MHNTISFMQEGELVAIGVVVERLGAHCTLDAPQRSAPSLVPIVRSFSTVLDGGMNSIDNRERESYFVAKSYLHIDITNVSDNGSVCILQRQRRRYKDNFNNYKYSKRSILRNQPLETQVLSAGSGPKRLETSPGFLF